MWEHKKQTKCIMEMLRKRNLPLVLSPIGLFNPRSIDRLLIRQTLEIIVKNMTVHRFILDLPIQVLMQSCPT